MLKIEDVKVGDRLVHKTSGLEVAVLSFFNGCAILDCIDVPICDLRHFKKKEQSQYTFDDLIDVAYKGFKDKVLFELNMTDKCIGFRVDESFTAGFDLNSISAGIKLIQSLYKETFVIECEEDIKRIKKGAEITLSNSNKSKVSVIDYDENTLKVANWDYFLQFFSLKGATVEQERGRDD